MKAMAAFKTVCIFFKVVAAAAAKNFARKLENNLTEGETKPSPNS